MNLLNKILYLLRIKKPVKLTQDEAMERFLCAVLKSEAVQRELLKMVEFKESPKL